MKLHRTRALAAFALLAGCASAPEPIPLRELSGGGYAMGTALEMTLLGPDTAVLDAARAQAFAEVERLETLLSTFRPESDVSRLNAAAGKKAVRVHPELAALLARALELSRATRGSFDVTVGPLVVLWTEAAARNKAPDRRAIESARARVGPDRLRIESDTQVALAAGSAIELGGVAKGYALDRVRAQLGAGVSAALLNFGQSSTWAIGHPPRWDGWRLLARAPGGGFAGMLTLRDRALSASESLGQSSEIAGQRYGHILDPRSGRPLTRSREALVVTTDATLAEALSKAVLVLGEAEGIALVEEWPEAEALLLDADGRSWRTSGWNEVTRFEAVSKPPTTN